MEIRMKTPGKESQGKETPRKHKSAALGKSSQPRVEKSLASETLPKASGSPAFPVVGIGASAGGLDAFTQLLMHLPTDTGMGFVLVQHSDPAHESALAQILARFTSMPVCAKSRMNCGSRRITFILFRRIPNKCGCRNLRCCEEPGHKPGACQGTVATEVLDIPVGVLLPAMP
jgi:CheB methylesterase